MRPTINLCEFLPERVQLPTLSLSTSQSHASQPMVEWRWRWYCCVLSICLRSGMESYVVASNFGKPTRERATINYYVTCGEGTTANSSRVSQWWVGEWEGFRRQEKSVEEFGFYWNEIHIFWMKSKVNQRLLGYWLLDIQINLVGIIRHRNFRVLNRPRNIICHWVS